MVIYTYLLLIPLAFATAVGLVLLPLQGALKFPLVLLTFSFLLYSIWFDLTKQKRTKPYLAIAWDWIASNFVKIQVVVEKIIEIIFWPVRNLLVAPAEKIATWLAEMVIWVKYTAIDYIKKVIEFTMKLVLFQYQELLNLFIKKFLSHFGIPQLKTIKLPMNYFIMNIKAPWE